MAATTACSAGAHGRPEVAGGAYRPTAVRGAVDRPLKGTEERARRAGVIHAILNADTVARKHARTPIVFAVPACAIVQRDVALVSALAQAHVLIIIPAAEVSLGDEVVARLDKPFDDVRNRTAAPLVVRGKEHFGQDALAPRRAVIVRRARDVDEHLTVDAGQLERKSRRRSRQRPRDQAYNTTNESPVPAPTLHDALPPKDDLTSQHLNAGGSRPEMSHALGPRA